MSATLIKYAGSGPVQRGEPSAYALFLMGLDTVEIANRLGVSEAVASRRVYVQRCREKGLSVETERRSA